MVKRVLVGAHYGLRDWLLQRVTAVIMLVYVVGLISFVLSASTGEYRHWQALFGMTWVKVVTLVTILGVLIHAWIGVRDIWMDYIQHVGLRLTMHTLTILWLLGSFIYACKIIGGAV